MEAEVVRQLTAETLATIDELIPEGRAPEVEVSDYAKRVQEATANLAGLGQAFPDRNLDALRQWSRYAQLWEVEDDLITVLQLAIKSHAGDARCSTEERRQMPETNVPKWFNLDEIVSPEIVADLAKIRAEAEQFAPTVEAFARRAFRVTQAWENTSHRAKLPDEVWALTQHASGAEAVFEVIERMVNDLKVAWLEKPERDKLPAWYFEEGAGLDSSAGEDR